MPELIPSFPRVYSASTPSDFLQVFLPLYTLLPTILLPQPSLLAYPVATPPWPSLNHLPSSLAGLPPCGLFGQDSLILTKR